MKSTILQILRSKIFFFVITSALILILNLAPLYLQYKHSPPGRTFSLIHNNVQDFFFYQALMNQGANGEILTSNPYTTETHPKTLIFSYFVWLGKLSSLLHLPFAITYHLFRILLSIIFLSLIFYFLNFIKVPYPRLTYLFFLFAGPLMHKISDGAKFISVPYMYWWTGVDAIRRVAYLPHHLLGSILLILLIINLIKFINHAKIINFWIVMLLVFPLSFIHPPSLFILLFTLPVALFIYKLKKEQIINNASFALSESKRVTGARYLVDVTFNPAQQQGGDGQALREKDLINNEKVVNKTLLLSLIILIASFLSLLLMVQQGKTSPIWQKPFAWEKTQQFPLIQELPFALGILFPLAIIGLYEKFKAKDFTDILVASWFAVPLLLIPFAPVIGISNIRLTQGLPYLFQAILVTSSLKFLEIKFKNKFSHSFELKINQNNHLKITLPILRICVVILFVIFSVPTLISSMKSQISEYWPIFGNVYLDNRLQEAFKFINENFPKNVSTLATFYSGNYLPAFTRTRSFIGHTGYTYNIEEKQKLVETFFQNKMKTPDVKNLLMNNKITLVFQGPEDKPIYSKYLYPEILKPIYDREEVTLYIPILE